MQTLAAEMAKSRRVLGLGAAGLLAGIALAAISGQAIGSWVTVLALLTMTAGLHKFGRLGADAPIEAAPSSAKHAEDR